MLGYYKNNEATEAVIDKDGWLHTGDLALMDAEGNVSIKGRSKNMLLGPSGQNIYPEEIEDKLNNMPYVAESIIVQQNEKTGKRFPYQKNFQVLEAGDGEEAMDIFYKEKTLHC